MNQKIRIYSLIILLIVLTSCSNNSSNPIDNNSTVKDTIVNIGNGQSCLVSTDGILKWDGLPQTEKTGYSIGVYFFYINLLVVI